MDELDELLDAANRSRSQAYAPYSGFRVGAAIRGRSGRIFAGCNVENAAFPTGTCAEAGAIAAMIAAGERQIDEILIIGDSLGPTPPCGACRQRIAEFADPRTRVIIASDDGARVVYMWEELLPHSFGPQNLRI